MQVNTGNKRFPLESMEDAKTSSNFNETVRELIERIELESLIYQDPTQNINSDSLKHIDLELQAQRIQKVLEMCINEISMVFLLSYFVSNNVDTTFLPCKMENQIKFTQKWFHTSNSHLSNDFNKELNKCLDNANEKEIVERVHQNLHKVCFLFHFCYSLILKILLFRFNCFFYLDFR